MTNANTNESLILQLQQHIKELENKISEQQKQIEQLNQILSDLALQTR